MSRMQCGQRVKNIKKSQVKTLKDLQIVMIKFSQKFTMIALGWFKNPVSSQTGKLMAATKFSDYLGLNYYKKAKKVKHFIHLALAYGHQSFGT